MNIMDTLKLAIANDPRPDIVASTTSKVSATIRRNRRRLGLPEYPTKEELAQWATNKKEPDNA